MIFSHRTVACLCLVAACLSPVFAQDNLLAHTLDGHTVSDEIIHTPSLHITPIESLVFQPSFIAEYSAGETIQLIEPTQEPIFTGSGRVILSSVSSYQAVGEGIGKCSLLTRKNLEMLLRNLGGSGHRIYQGDAAELIIYGLKNNTVQAFSDKKSLFATLEARKEANVETVFDAYRRNTPSIEMAEGDERTRGFFYQGHRAVIFLADDENWYILDTIDGKKTATPQLLSDYLPSDFGERQWFLRTPGYSAVDIVSAHEFDSILPFLSPELQLWWNGKHEFVSYHDGETSLIGEVVNSHEPASVGA